MTVIALSIMPYITASIVIQLLVALIPSLQRDVKENQESGKRKIGKWTRILATLLSIMQATLLARYALQMNQAHPGIVVHELFKIQAFWNTLALLYDCSLYYDYWYTLPYLGW